MTTDQCGVARPQPAGGLCDIGAYEAQPAMPPNPLPPRQPTVPVIVGKTPAPLLVVRPTGAPITNPTPLLLPPRRP